MPTVEVTTFVLTGPPTPLGYGTVLTPTPPAPVPGPYGDHEYEVIVCDKHGVAYGKIPSAVTTQIDFELDAVAATNIDFWIQDPQAAALLPLNVIPGVREVQIWRDQVLIFWGWPTSATWDTTTVHLTVSNLLWPLGQRELGPGFRRYLTNPQFEDGLTGWTAVNCVASPSPTTKALGTKAARLVQPAALHDSYLHQTVTVDLTASRSGIAFALSAWVYLDGSYAYTGTALNQRGLYIEDNFGNVTFCAMPENFAANTWTRIEVQPTSPDPAIIAAPGVITVFDIRLYCPGGSVVWDAVNFSVYENVSSPPSSPPATAWDVANIIKALLASAQNAAWSKSDLAFQFYGAPTGVVLNRVYDVSTNQVILDAINEFPSIGICDFGMTWDATGHFRGLRIYSPAKGQVKYNAVINPDVNVTTQLGGAVDGTQVGTVWRVLGQGATGPAGDTGFASFASYLGGRIMFPCQVSAGIAVITDVLGTFTSADVGEIVYNVDGIFLPGTYITSVPDSHHAHISSKPLISEPFTLVGIGGITLDHSQAALPDQPISTLQQSAEANLLQTMRALALPTPRIRADGPNGLFGVIEVGDIVFVSAHYGWVQIDPTMVRISRITLYPTTEELELTLMPLNQIAAS